MEFLKSDQETVLVEKLLTAMKARDCASVRNLFAAFIDQNESKLRAHLLRVVSFGQVKLKEFDRVKAYLPNSALSPSWFRKNARHLDPGDELYSETVKKALEQLLWQAGSAETQSRLPFDPKKFPRSSRKLTSWFVKLADFLRKDGFRTEAPKTRADEGFYVGKENIVVIRDETGNFSKKKPKTNSLRDESRRQSEISQKWRRRVDPNNAIRNSNRVTDLADLNADIKKAIENYSHRDPFIKQRRQDLMRFLWLYEEATKEVAEMKADLQKHEIQEVKQYMQTALSHYKHGMTA